MNPQDLTWKPEPEEINLLETDKAKNTLKFAHNCVDVNQRGREWRPEFRTKNSRWCGKPVYLPLMDIEERYEEKEDSGKERSNGENPFLCEGMNIIISKDGKAAAISFNTNYKGERIIRE